MNRDEPLRSFLLLRAVALVSRSPRYAVYGKDFPWEILYEKMRAERLGRGGGGGRDGRASKRCSPFAGDLTRAGLVIHKADIEPALECKSSGSQR